MNKNNFTPFRLLAYLVLALGMVLFSGAGPAVAEESLRQQSDLFEIHVRPTLVAHCIQCHGDTKQEGGLRLTSLIELLEGGDSGPAIVPGEPDASLLVEAIRYESYEMPPEAPLADDTINGITAWISAGAHWPVGTKLEPRSGISDQDRQWWCYQPMASPSIPLQKTSGSEDQGWCRNEIDHFVLEKLRQNGIAPSPQAEPHELVRRLHFAVTGLPPQQDALSQPENDYPPQDQPPVPTKSGSDDFDARSLDRLLEHLLDQPEYGENQARFWLDLVRYADSDGYRADGNRPDAHLYRDYVIRSFNDDKPYDRFVLEQLAGDEVDPGSRDALIGTMFLRHWIYEWNQRDVETQWQEILSDITETTADVFLAQGLKCARCHDHKFDPLLQKDYFRLQAFFAPVQPREDQPIADIGKRTEHFQQMRAWEQATEPIRKRLYQIEMPVLLSHATGEPFDKFIKEIRDMVLKWPPDRTPYEHQIALLTSRQFKLQPEKLDQWLDEQSKAEREQLQQQLAEFDSIKPEPLPILKFAASDVGPTAPPTSILDQAASKVIEPGFPSVLGEAPAEIMPPPEALQSTGRRTALAQWIIDPENPLTARVIVNRIWQQHFGRGLVETCSDFGRLGDPPSHPELLDWLAQRLIADGWSLKKLHRLILSSATYRQSSRRTMDDYLRRTDPHNTLLWRMNPRRLSGEEIHDAILVASGELCSSKLSGGELGNGKRAVYKTVKRNRLDPLLKSFDFPDRIRSHGDRHQTTTSPQALMLLNDQWFHQRAAEMEKQLQATEIDPLIAASYERLFFRMPSEQEAAMAKQFYTSYRLAAPKTDSPEQLRSLPDGRAAMDFSDQQPALIEVPSFKELPTDDFTVEATVLLRSLYPDASVRTIAARWSGDKKDRGWALGVTSSKSAFKPRNLILQLIGSRGEGAPEYEVIASNLRLDLDTPYRIAVSVDIDDLTDQGITFMVQDLSRKDSKPEIAKVAHQANNNIGTQQAVQIGGRSRLHQWDGLIHHVRLYDTAIDLLGSASDHESRLLFDVQFTDAEPLGSDASGNQRHAVVTTDSSAAASPEQSARVALLHALFCSNEMIYVD